MKKFKQLLQTCCLFISIASLVFITTVAKAQKGNNPNNQGNCCAYAGLNQTITTCTSVTIGPLHACSTGWNCGTNPVLPCPTTYSWAPSTGLTCTTCLNPMAGCGGVVGSGTRTYTLTTSGCGSGYNPGISTMTLTYNSCCSGCCRIGYFDNPTKEVVSADIKVFPNPSSGKITVTFDVINANTNIEVYNIDGKLIMKKNNVADKTVELDLSNAAKGTYFIQVINADQGIVNKKILIQ